MADLGINKFEGEHGRSYISRGSRRPSRETPACHWVYSAYLKLEVIQPQGEPGVALEETSATDSTTSGEAWQRHKPRPTIPGFEGTAAHRAMYEQHARQHGPASSHPSH